MEIIENFILGKKGNSDECEDGLVITDKIIAVVDGATTKSQLKFNNMTSGAFARKIICDILSSSEIEKLSCENLFSQLTNTLRDDSDNCHPNLEYIEYPRISVIIYNGYYNEIWAYGDCQCIINGVLHTHEKHIDVLASELRSFFLEHALLNGHSLEDISFNDIGRSRISDVLKDQSLFENKDITFGYPVINCFPINPNMIVRYKVEKNDEIVLSSDGYPELKTSLKESEDFLKNVLDNDQLCFRIYKTTKGVLKENLSFDDRCYCRFRV